MAKKSSAKPAKKKVKKNIAHAVVHVRATFNNTIITFTDKAGNTISWGSAGVAGFKGSRKSTPFASGQASEKAAKAAMDHGVTTVDILIKGPGSGRESAVRSIQSSGIRILSIRDVTPLPHNGCRAPKRRRV
jgi:small subunit ribosomal protein S11